MDFSKLLSGLAEEVKRKPNKKPDVLPLPSEQAIGEVVEGVKESSGSGGWKSHKETMDAALPGWNDPFGKYVGGDTQASATEQGIADEPANADNVYQTVDTSKVDELARVEGANRPDMSSLIPYQRDEQGYAIRPEGVDPQASIRRGDGSASDWSWAGQDSVRNYSGKPAVGTNRRVADDPTAGTATSGTDPRDTGSKKSGNTWKSHAETMEAALGESPLDKALRQAEENYLAKLNAPIEKQSFWKDFGAKLIQGADAFFNGNRLPIQGWGRLKHDQAIQNANAKLNPLVAMRKEQEDSAFRQVRTGTIINDDARQAKAAKDLTDWRTSETNRKINADVSRERTARMTQVAGMFKSLPAYDPADPKFKELTEALGDVGLPLTPKDAKKKVDLKQDQRTGAWTVILTNPVTGQQEARNVVKDGKPFASTPTVVMQGELGLLKQNDQQAFTEQQNTLDRNLRVELQNSVQSFGRQQTLQKAIDAYKQLYFKTNGKNPTQAEIDAYITNTVTPMLEVGMNPIP